MKEKDVTLDIAHRVAPVLQRSAAWKRRLPTRDDDRYVTLEERTARANGFGADVFVSIHCNAAEARAHHGVETYVLDTTNSEMAGRIAARENATSQAANLELGAILSNMRLADQATRSTKLAELMQRAAMASLAHDYPDVSDGGVHTAGFYVLVGARMPGDLVRDELHLEPRKKRSGSGASDAYKGSGSPTRSASTRCRPIAKGRSVTASPARMVNARVSRGATGRRGGRSAILPAIRGSRTECAGSPGRVSAIDTRSIVHRELQGQMGSRHAARAPSNQRRRDRAARLRESASVRVRGRRLARLDRARLAKRARGSRRRLPTRFVSSRCYRRGGAALWPSWGAG